jgi:DNA-binding transcriptional regulator GbsR (MarR family)
MAVAGREREREPGAASPSGALVRSESRPAEAVVFDRELVSFFVDAAEMIGVPNSVAAIYGICFASAAPLSFADIAERLDISQGSISQGLRVLKNVGALRVVGTHERREYFAPDLKLRDLASRFIEERLEKQLEAGSNRWRAVNAALPKGLASETAELKKRLKYLQTWHEKARALVPLIKTFVKLT